MEELGKEDQGNLTQIKCSNGLIPGTSKTEKGLHRAAKKYTEEGVDFANNDNSDLILGCNL